MRVVHLIPVDLARGAQTYLRSLLDELAAGHDEHVAVSLFAAERASSGSGANGGGGSSGGSGGSGGGSGGVRPGVLRRAGFDPRAAARLRRRLAGLRPDVIVTHGGEGLKYAVPTRPAGVPVVYYKIGMVGRDLRNPARRAVYRWLVRRVAVVAAVSEEAADDAVAVLRAPADRVVVIPNGRDPDRYRPGPGDVDPPRLVLVGALTPGKRPGLFLDVVRALRGRGGAFDAAIVGDGPLLDTVRREAVGLGVDVLGRRHDVPEILASSSVLLLTSASEGMPGVLIEAGLAGIPVVTTAVSGAGTVVDHGVTGFVVGLDDTRGLVDAASRLLAEPDLRRRMGAAARQRCLERFTMTASARRWDDVLDGLRRVASDPRPEAGV